MEAKYLAEALSSSCSGCRAVATRVSPPARTARASCRPSPRELPVISHVLGTMGFLLPVDRLLASSYQLPERDGLVDAADEAAVDADGGAADVVGVRASEVGNGGGDLLGSSE